MEFHDIFTKKFTTFGGFSWYFYRNSWLLVEFCDILTEFHDFLLTFKKTFCWDFIIYKRKITLWKVMKLWNYDKLQSYEKLIQLWYETLWITVKRTPWASLSLMQKGLCRIAITMNHPLLSQSNLHIFSLQVQACTLLPKQGCCRPEQLTRNRGLEQFRVL